MCCLCVCVNSILFLNAPTNTAENDNGTFLGVPSTGKTRFGCDIITLSCVLHSAVQIKTALLGVCIFKSVLAFEKKKELLPGQNLKIVDAAASAGVEETPASLSYIIKRIQQCPNKRF